MSRVTNAYKIRVVKERKKVCTKCKIEQPLDCFGVCSDSFDGRRQQCNGCRHEYYVNHQEDTKQRAKEWRIKHKPVKPIKIVKEGYKICNTCNNEKPHSEFHKNNRRKDKYSSFCKGCAKERANQRHLGYKLCGKRVCSRCKIEKPVSEFYDSSTVPYCIQCVAKYVKQKRIQNKTIAVGKQATGAKVCNRCNREKPYSKFYRDYVRPDGYSLLCKRCASNYQKLIQKEKKAQWEGGTGLSVNKTKVCSICEVKQSLENFDISCRSIDGRHDYCKLCKKQQYVENKEEVKGRAIRYYAENKEHAKKMVAHYRKNNRSKINEREKKRRMRDPVYKLRCDVSRAILQFLKGNGGSKNGESILKHIEFSPKQLKEHLESLFTSEMNWNNHGSFWHIHHIKPASYFTCSTMEDPMFKICWGLSNLMPLNKRKNLELGGLWHGKKLTLEQHIDKSLSYLPKGKEKILCH